MSQVKSNPYILLAIAIAMGVVGQFMFKHGLNTLSAKGVKIVPSLAMIKIFFTPYIFTGIMCYGLSTFGYLSALSKLPLSVAYPTIAVSYVIVYAISVLFLKEQFTYTKLIGNILIIFGIALLYWGQGPKQ